MYCIFNYLGFVVIKKVFLYGSLSQNRILHAICTVRIYQPCIKGKTGLYYPDSVNCSVSENGCLKLVYNFTVVRYFMTHSAMLFDISNLAIILVRVSPRINFIYHILVVFNIIQIMI